MTLNVATSTPEAAFHVYLEDIAPDGRVTYITEGILRAMHRQVSDETSAYYELGPFHTMERADALPMIAGEVTEINFKLYATSVLIKQGHQIRVAIAGYDGSTFENYPADETPRFTVYRNNATPSFIVLPVQER